MNRPFLSGLVRRIEAAEAKVPANRPIIKAGWFAPLQNHEGEKHFAIVSERKISDHVYWCQFEQRPGKVA